MQRIFSSKIQLLVWLTGLLCMVSYGVQAQDEPASKTPTEEYYYTQDFKKCPSEEAHWIRVVQKMAPEYLKEFWDYTAERKLVAHGFVYEIDAEDGTKWVFHGEYEEYDSEGKIKVKGTFHEGQRNGKWYGYQGDKLTDIIPYNRNLKHGHCIWHKDSYYIQSMYSRGRQKDALVVAFDDQGLAIDIDSTNYRPVLETPEEARLGENKVKFFFKNGIVVGAKVFRYAGYNQMPTMIHLYLDQYRPKELCATSAEVSFVIKDRNGKELAYEAQDLVLPSRRTVWNSVLSQIRNTMNQDYEALYEVTNDNLPKLITYVTTNTLRVNHVTPSSEPLPSSNPLTLAPNTPYYYTTSCYLPEFGTLVVNVEIEGMTYSINFSEADIVRINDKPHTGVAMATETTPKAPQEEQVVAEATPSQPIIKRKQPKPQKEVAKPQKAEPQQEKKTVAPKAKPQATTTEVEVEEWPKEEVKVNKFSSIKSGATVVFAIMGRASCGLLDQRKTATSLAEHAQEVAQNVQGNLFYGGSVGFMGKRLFVGGGVEYLGKDYIPVFAHVRINLFNFAVTPFIDGKFGINTQAHKESNQPTAGDLINVIKSRPMYASVGGGLRMRMSRGIVFNLEAAYSGLEYFPTDKAYSMNSSATSKMGMFPSVALGLELNI